VRDDLKSEKILGEEVESAVWEVCG
jgi:hypothetical protein